jgi:AcrR family transcriptional regulator
MARQQANSKRYKNSDESRQRIMAAAVELFREVGFEKATMRSIAERADVSLGNAYYYYPAKEYLVISLYEQINAEQLKRSRSVQIDGAAVESSLLSVFTAQLNASQEHRAILQDIFRQAADFRSPLNPFSDATKHIRAASLDFFKEVADQLPGLNDELRAELPGLLLMFKFAIVLMWLHDTSEKQQRTQELVSALLGILFLLMRTLSNPLAGHIRSSLMANVRDVKEVLASFKPAGGDAAEA